MKTQTKFRQTKIGIIPKEWEIEEVDNVAKINELTINKSFLHKEIEYVDIDSVNKGIIAEPKTISLKDSPSRAKRIVRLNDIIISTVRPNLKHFAFINKRKPNMIVSTGFAVISSKKINPKFLYYYLTTNSYTNYLSAIADSHTSAYPSFNPNIIEKSQIPLPSDNEQYSIVKILSDLDSKIEINQHMNKTLEEIGKTIFKHWFIDFEFPNEDGKPYKLSGGKMVYNDDVGKEIPQGWDVKPLDIFGKIICGKTPSKSNKEFFNGNIPFIKIPDMHDQLFIIHTSDSLSEKGRNHQENKTLPIGSICVSCIATVGLVSITSKESQTNQQINSVVAYDKHSRFYLFYTMQSMKQDLVYMGSGGTATLNVNTTSFSNIKIIYPKKEVIKKFDEIIQPLFAKLLSNSIETHSLSQIFDLIHPKLMSGKIRLPM